MQEAFDVDGPKRGLVDKASGRSETEAERPSSSAGETEISGQTVEVGSGGLSVLFSLNFSFEGPSLCCSESESCSTNKVK